MTFEKIKEAVLKDKVTGNIHTLAALVIEHGAELSIGRNRDSAIVLKGVPRRSESGVSYSASRVHAIITYDGINREYSIRDNGSTNGTRVNGDVLQAEREIRRLQDGDEIAFGLYYFMIYEEPEELKAA